MLERSGLEHIRCRVPYDAGENAQGFVAEETRLEAERAVARAGKEQHLAGMQQRRMDRQHFGQIGQ